MTVFPKMVKATLPEVMHSYAGLSVFCLINT